MGRAFTPGLRVREKFVLSRYRELSVAGTILVKEGDKVKPTDIIGRAELQGELLILKLSEQLGIEPDEAIAGLKVKVGDVVKGGDIICEHSGLFGWLKSRFNAPQPGTIEFITERTGHIGLRLPSRPIELTAYLGGTVKEITPGRAVRIEAHCAFVQGIFGVGGERFGNLQKIQSPDKPIEIEKLPSDLTGKILFGGSKASGGILRILAERGAQGLITGSIDDQALSSYLGYDLGLALTGDEDISMTMIITEGFGGLPLSKQVFDLLSSLEGSFASINGATQVRAGAVRPEVIVVNESYDGSADSSSEEAEGLTIGSKVRLIRVPYFGLRGEVIELPHELKRIETGAYTRVLRARLEDGREVTVPRSNVEG